MTVLHADSEVIWLIVLAALVTFFTRFGGHLILSRFSSIHPRVEAGLEAVPMAVIAALIAPKILDAGLAEIIALLVTGFAIFRLPGVVVVPLGIGVLVILRQMGL